MTRNFRVVALRTPRRVTTFRRGVHECHPCRCRPPRRRLRQHGRLCGHVLSGKRSVSSSTRERVERSIEELGYRPHAGARALASNRSGIIALMVPRRTDIHVPVMLQIAMAVTTTARAHGYDVLLLTGEEGPEAVRRIEGSARRTR